MIAKNRKRVNKFVVNDKKNFISQFGKGGNSFNILDDISEEEVDDIATGDFGCPS